MSKSEHFEATHIWAIRRETVCREHSSVSRKRHGLHRFFSHEFIPVRLERINEQFTRVFKPDGGIFDIGPGIEIDGFIHPLDNAREYWLEVGIDHKGPGDDGTRPRGKYGEIR